MWEMAPDAYLIVHNTQIGFKMIDWTLPMFQAFKEQYKQALLDGLSGDDTFTFNGNPFVVAYAKYLIEYIEFSGKFVDYVH
jgi:hypothetical protein